MNDDELLGKAKEASLRVGYVSVSYVQRMLRIGYTLAARLVDQMIDDGFCAQEYAPGEGYRALVAARIQRRRTKGWRMPANTVCVTRPSIFGNPWTIKSARESGLFLPEACPQVVVNEFRAWLEGKSSPNGEHLGSWHRLEDRRARLLENLDVLHRKNLACWCAEGQPCHADVLLEMVKLMML